MPVVGQLWPSDNDDGDDDDDDDGDDDDGDDGDDDDYDDLKGARTCIVSLRSEVSSGDLCSIFLNVTSAAACLQFISSPCCHASHISTSY